MKLEFLPAYYPPDFNPIEQAFSSIKSYMCCHYNYLSWSSNTDIYLSDEAEVYTMLHEAVFLITPDDMKGFYYHSGYVEKDQWEFHYNCQ